MERASYLDMRLRFLADKEPDPIVSAYLHAIASTETAALPTLQLIADRERIDPPAGLETLA